MSMDYTVDVEPDLAEEYDGTNEETNEDDAENSGGDEYLTDPEESESED